MADHRAEQVLNAIVTNIGLSTSALTNVYRSPARQLPDDMKFAIEVMMGADEELTFSGNTFVDSWLNIYVDLHAKVSQPADRSSAAVPVYESSLMTLRKETHINIMADNTQGLAFVIETLPNGAQDPIYNGEGDQVTAILRTVWRVKYRTSFTDPSS